MFLTLSSSIPTTCLKFSFEELLKKKEITVLQNLFVASLAGIVNVITTCPLWVANTRLKTQRNMADHEKKYHGLIDCLYKMAKVEGISTLWSGVGASLILVSNPTINHVVYDKVKSLYVKRALALGRKGLTPLEIFIAGAIAKAIATIITYPIQLAQSRQRAGHGAKKETSDNKKVMYEVLWSVYKNDGILGCFSGIEVKLLQTVLMAAFHFLCYEQIKDFIFAVMTQIQKK